MPLSKPQFDLLLSQLPQLSPSQAVQVRESLNFLFKTAEEINSNHWLLDGAYTELKRRGLISNPPPPFKVVKTWSTKSPLIQQLQGLETFLLKVVNLDLNPAEKSALAQTCISALCDWLIERKLTPGLRMVILNLGNVPVALDSAFPGYAAAGMLGMVLKKKYLASEK